MEATPSKSVKSSASKSSTPIQGRPNTSQPSSSKSIKDKYKENAEKQKKPQIDSTKVDDTGKLHEPMKNCTSENLIGAATKHSETHETTEKTKGKESAHSDYKMEHQQRASFLMRQRNIKNALGETTVFKSKRLGLEITAAEALQLRNISDCDSNHLNMIISAIFERTKYENLIIAPALMNRSDIYRPSILFQLYFIPTTVSCKIPKRDKKDSKKLHKQYSETKADDENERKYSNETISCLKDENNGFELLTPCFKSESRSPASESRSPASESSSSSSETSSSSSETSSSSSETSSSSSETSSSSSETDISECDGDSSYPDISDDDDFQDKNENKMEVYLEPLQYCVDAHFVTVAVHFGTKEIKVMDPYRTRYNTSFAEASLLQYIQEVVLTRHIVIEQLKFWNINSEDSWEKSFETKISNEDWDEANNMDILYCAEVLERYYHAKNLSKPFPHPVRVESKPYTTYKYLKKIYERATTMEIRTFTAEHILEYTKKLLGNQTEKTKNQVAYKTLQCVIDDNILSPKSINFVMKLIGKKSVLRVQFLQCLQVTKGEDDKVRDAKIEHEKWNGQNALWIWEYNLNKEKFHILLFNVPKEKKIQIFAIDSLIGESVKEDIKAILKTIIIPHPHGALEPTIEFYTSSCDNNDKHASKSTSSLTSLNGIYGLLQGKGVKIRFRKQDLKQWLCSLILENTEYFNDFYDHQMKAYTTDLYFVSNAYKYHKDWIEHELLTSLITDEDDKNDYEGKLNNEEKEDLTCDIQGISDNNLCKNLLNKACSSKSV